MRKLALLVAVTLALPLAACAADTEGEATPEAASSESAIEARHVKVLAQDRAYPGELLLAGDKLYWSESKFVGSGDPELDQQFAYWTGTLYSFNVGRSRAPKELNQLGGTLRSAQQVGSAIYLTTAGGVAKTTAADLDEGKAWKNAYSDMDHFEISEEEEVTSAYVSAGRVYVLRSRGELVSTKTDGSDYRLHVKGSDYAGNLVVVNGTALYTSSSDDPNLTSIWRVDLGAASPKPKEITRARSVTKLVLDGNDVLFGASKTTIAGAPAPGVYRVGAASGSPELVVAGFDEVHSVAADADRVYFGGTRGSAEGVYTVARASLGANARPAKLYDVKSPREILPTADAVFVASTALTRGNRYAGSVVRLDKAGIR